MNRIELRRRPSLVALGATEIKFKEGSPLAAALSDTKEHIARAFAEHPKVTVKVSVMTEKAQQKDRG